MLFVRTIILVFFNFFCNSPTIVVGFMISNATKNYCSWNALLCSHFVIHICHFAENFLRENEIFNLIIHNPHQKPA